MTHNLTLRTPVRLIVAPVNTPATCVRDLVYSDRIPGKDRVWDPQPPWEDVSFSSFGVAIEEFDEFETIHIQINERTPKEIEDKLAPGDFALAVLWQDESNLVHAFYWPVAMLEDITYVELRGEATSFPLGLRAPRNRKEF